MDDLVLRIIASHLGSGMSSILFRKLREINPLVYEVGVYFPIREYYSPFIINASTTSEKTSKVLNIIRSEWFKIIEKKLKSKELDLAKAKYKGNLALETETIAERAERQALRIHYDLEADNNEQITKKINLITTSDIIRVAKNYLNSPLVSIAGDEGTIRDYKNKHFTDLALNDSLESRKYLA